MPKEIFLPKQKRYRSVVAHQDLSDEEIAMDWTLSEADSIGTDPVLVHIQNPKYRGGLEETR